MPLPVLTNPEVLTELRETNATLAHELYAASMSNEILQESLADAALAYEDIGWRRMSDQVARDLSPAQRAELCDYCSTMAKANPIVKRGVNTRIAYVWGQGFTVTAQVHVEDDEDGTKAKAIAADVNSLIDEFMKSAAGSLTSSEAHERLERDLAGKGEVFIALFTNPVMGKVQPRTVPPAEIVEIISNPEDREEPWFYVREHQVPTFTRGVRDEANTRVTYKRQRTAYPAAGYHPSSRVKSINSATVRWDAPVLHVAVNRDNSDQRGIPDVFAVLAWARAYTGFLSDWAGVVKALSKFAWRLTGKGRTPTQKAAEQIAATTTQASGVPPLSGNPVGQVAAQQNMQLEAIPKSGATIDSDSGRPLAAMVAAGLGVPVTILLADPGITGARATADTLRDPLVLEMGMRRLTWQAAFTAVFQYVIRSSIEAPQGILQGKVRINEWGRRVVELEGGVEPNLVFAWPPLAEMDPAKIVEAVMAASDSDTLHPKLVSTLLMQALGVDDPDDWVAKMTDENGVFIYARSNAGDALIQRSRNGDPDPAAGLQ